MPFLTKNLELDKCPHCNVHMPLLQSKNFYDTTNHKGKNKLVWVIMSVIIAVVLY